MLIDELQSVWPDWAIEEPEIGHGAYGKVYKIKRSLTGFGEVEYQALKVVSIPLDEDDIDILTLGHSEREAKNEYYRSMAEKLAKEATFMSDLQGNPYIVRYHEHAIIPRSDSKIGWDVLIRMELLAPFKKHMAEHGFTRQDVIRLGVDICKALELCRKKDVIHRDIKPENIFISDVGNYKLGDFGVAVNADKTLGGLSQKGTYAYMAPEVYKGQPYGPTIDIYSLGIILYRLLNDGKEPFMPPKGIAEKYADRELALSKRMQCEPLPYPENESGKLARVVMKAASPHPEDRYGTPTEMRRALEELVDANDGELMILPMKNADSFFTKRASAESKPSVRPLQRADDPIDDPPQPEESPKKKSFMIICGVLVVLLVLIVCFVGNRKGRISGDSPPVDDENIEESVAINITPTPTPIPEADYDDEHTNLDWILPEDGSAYSSHSEEEYLVTEGVEEFEHDNDVETIQINPSDYPEMMVTSVRTTLGLRATAEKTTNEIGQLTSGSMVNLIDCTDSDFWYVYSKELDAYGFVTSKHLVSSTLVTGSEQTVTLPEQNRSYTINYPWINLDSEDVLELNLEIRDGTCALGPMEMNECYGITYAWYVRGDILSLIIEKEYVNDGRDIYVYNVSISGARLAPNDAVMEACGYTEATFHDVLSATISDYIQKSMEQSNYYTEEEIRDYISQSTTDEMLESAQLFINDAAQPCAVATYYYPAGGGIFESIFNLETGENESVPDI